MGSGSDTAY